MSSIDMYVQIQKGRKKQKACCYDGVYVCVMYVEQGEKTPKQMAEQYNKQEVVRMLTDYEGLKNLI